MTIISKEIILKNYERGFNLITDNVIKNIPEINNLKNGILFLFIKHTSASLTINENSDYTVHEDLESYFTRTVKEDDTYYKHNFEGADDMPAHIKSTIIGNSIHIPIINGKLNLGTWQGIFLCEHRNNKSTRIISATLLGNKF